MSQSRQIIVTAFALFSLFFGAGNLVLPPFLGYNAGTEWYLVELGFAVSAVVIPILAIYGHSKLQGTMLDFGNKVSPWFAVAYSVLVYAISVSLPSPRTASVTYEMAIQPYFDLSALSLSLIYFALVLLFVLNRNKILSIIGKYLTPLIILILLLVIVLGFAADSSPLATSAFENSFTEGILEGYQTFDAIGGVVVGGVIVISIGLQGSTDYASRKKIISKAGLLAGIGLFVIYAGLIALGAWQSGSQEVANRTELLNLLSSMSLGNAGTAVLAVLVALACFTTAVGVVAGTSDFFSGLFGNSKRVFAATAIASCIIGVLVGQNTVGYIIDVAIPALMFIYPITIVLIILSITPVRYASSLVYRATVIATIVFSIPDFLLTLNFDLLPQEILQSLHRIIPFSEVHMGWILPAVLVFILTNLPHFLSGDRKKNYED